MCSVDQSPASFVTILLLENNKNKANILLRAGGGGGEGEAPCCRSLLPGEAQVLRLFRKLEVKQWGMFHTHSRAQILTLSDCVEQRSCWNRLESK